jgi:predicted  nucleic acid-binding Zn-ribbon protein
MSLKKWWKNLWKSSNQKKLEKEVGALKREISEHLKTTSDLKGRCTVLEFNNEGLKSKIKSLENDISRMDINGSRCDEVRCDCTDLMTVVNEQITEFLSKV